MWISGHCALEKTSMKINRRRLEANASRCSEPAYHCMFERVKGENSRWNPHSWFARFRKATQALGTEHLGRNIRCELVK